MQGIDENGRTQQEPMRVVGHAVLLAITVLGLGLRLWRIGAESLWFDEWFSLGRAFDPLWELIGGARTSLSPPLYYVLLKPFVHLLGDSEWALRLPSALAGAAAIPLLARVGRRLFGRMTGLSAAFLLAVSSYHIRYSQEARMYALVVLLGLLSMEFFLAGRERATRLTRAGYVLSSAALLYTHYFGGFLLVAQGLAAALAALRERAARPILRWVGEASIVAVLFLPWLPVFLRQSSNAPGNLSWVGQYSSTVAQRVAHALSGPVLFLLVVLAIVAIVIAKRRSDLLFGHGGSWFLVVAWSLVPHLGLIVLSLAAFPVYVVRYAIVGLPALFLATAATARLVRPAALQCVLIIGLGLGSLVLTTRAFARNDKPQWREAVAWVAERAAAEDLVLVSGRESVYYVEREDGLRSRAVCFQSQAEAGDRCGPMADRIRVWYLQQLHWEVPAPLAQGYVERERKEFSQVAVVLFDRVPPGLDM